jgi:hypothetical protein
LAKLFVGTSRHHRGTVSARHNAELARDDDQIARTAPVRIGTNWCTHDVTITN